MSDTPRTDKQHLARDLEGDVGVNFARELERELNAERKKSLMMRDALIKADREFSRLFQVLPLSGKLPSPDVMQECAYAINTTKEATP